MKKPFLALGLAALLAGCSSEIKPTTVTGTVIDATMNGMMLKTAAGDSINLSTMDVPDLQGVLLADSVEVIYKDTLDYKLVQSITILRHSPYFFIQGSWTEPNPIDAEQLQGFTLSQGGAASSINMATLVYSAWNMPTLDSLSLGGQSIGNKQTIDFSTTYKIDRIDADSLILSSNGTVVMQLGRQAAQ